MGENERRSGVAELDAEFGEDERGRATVGGGGDGKLKGDRTADVACRSLERELAVDCTSSAGASFDKRGTNTEEPR